MNPTVIAILVLAFVVRLALGLLLPLDADESVEGIAALRLLHGAFPLMEPDGRYLGALESYLLAPFVLVLGPTALAIRVGMSAIGVAYVAAMYRLGRCTVPGSSGGAWLALVASIFPLFAVIFGIRARTYGTLLLFEALVFVLAVRLLWEPGPRRRRDWVLLGLVGGAGLWVHPLLAIPVSIVLVGLLLRARDGLGWTVAGALAGYSPWLLYNLLTGLCSLRHLYSPAQAYSVPIGVAAGQLLSNALPVFVGSRVDFCGYETVAAWTVDAGLLLLFGAAGWLRRGWRGPVGMILFAAPLSIAAVTVGPFNGLSCEPRYLLPLAIPLALAVALLLADGGIRRLLTGLGLLAWLAVAGLTVLHTSQAYTGRLFNAGELDAIDVPAAARVLAAHPPEALWAQYWLARPVDFQAGDTFPVGEYEGYIGFRSTQTAALAARHPSWLFLAADPVLPRFEAECARRGISYQRSEPTSGLVLYSNLSSPLHPADLGLGGQTLQQADDYAALSLR